MTLRESRTPRLDRPCGGRAKKGPGDPERLLRPGPVFDIQEFGATPDGTALNTAAIQRVTVAEEQRMINNDGIDLDACRDVTVSDSFFRTADDCLILRSSN